MKATYRSVTVIEQGGLGRRLTLSESPRPDTITVTIFSHDEDGRRAQTLDISREAWEEICRLTGRYSSSWDWAESERPEGPAEAVPAASVMSNEDLFP